MCQEAWTPVFTSHSSQRRGSEAATKDWKTVKEEGLESRPQDVIFDLADDGPSQPTKWEERTFDLL